jgi:type III secretion protein D
MQHLVADDGVWRFEIAGGPNAGASVTLARGRYRLGSDTASDIVLADSAVSPSHAVLELARDRADTIALAPGVLLQRRQLSAGRPVALKRGTVVTLGETRLKVGGPAVPVRLHRKASVTVCLALLGLAGAGAAYHGAAPVAIGAMRPDQPPTGGAGSATLDRAVADFRAHLADTRLAPGLQVSASDGVVLATGTVLPNDRAIWLDAEKWFDGHLGGRYALADRVSVATPADLPKLEVAAVSMAPVPNVITRDGQHYTVGAVLRDGWSVDRITPNDIVLRSGERKIRIAL